MPCYHHHTELPGTLSALLPSIIISITLSYTHIIIEHINIIMPRQSSRRRATTHHHHTISSSIRRRRRGATRYAQRVIVIETDIEYRTILISRHMPYINNSLRICARHINTRNLLLLFASASPYIDNSRETPSAAPALAAMLRNHRIRVMLPSNRHHMRARRARYGAQASCHKNNWRWHVRDIRTYSQ